MTIAAARSWTSNRSTQGISSSSLWNMSYRSPTFYNEEIGAHLFNPTAQRISWVLRRSGVRCEGVNLFLADGAAAGQEVFHVQIHLFLRFRDDGFGLRVGPGYTTLPTRKGLDATAATIRARLEGGRT